MEKEVQLCELNRYRALEELSKKIDETKESQSSLADLYENQLKILKQKHVDM